MKRNLLLMILSCIILCFTFSGCGSNSGGSSTEDEAVRKFLNACYVSHDKKDIMYSIMPKEYWDYLVEVSGLPEDRIFYKTFGEYIGASNDEELKSLEPDWLYEALEAKDFNDAMKKLKIEEKDDAEDEEYQYFNETLSHVDLMIDELYKAYTTDGYKGNLYKINDKWYYSKGWSWFEYGKQYD
ncbi:MAG: hypothetical protein Q4D76_17060 [Oscillospiraceae bacterium]|nr:hypothetical protein [Oscillospiraceae bacterium]